MKINTIMIGSWPTPEKPTTMDIPLDVLEEFGEDLKINVGCVAIGTVPTPDRLLKKLEDKEFYRKITENFDIMLVPKKLEK